MKSRYIPGYSTDEINKINVKLNPRENRACNNNIRFSAGEDIYSGDFKGNSLKRSTLKNCTFNNALFDHTSFCGSILNDVIFTANCKFKSVYLEQSVLTGISFEKDMSILNCNFSNSFIKDMKMDSVKLRGTYFSDCYIDNSTFKNCEFRSTMFGGAMLSNCSLLNCNMRNLNIEFVTLLDCDLTDTVISYFQLPYIIGLFANSNNIKKAKAGLNSEQTLSMDDYIKNIEDAIIYFTGLEEYFPMANLYYAKGENEIAINCIFEGIHKALSEYNIRMVENFCKLGQVYELLEPKDLKEILREVDYVIKQANNHPMYEILLRNSAQLKTTINNYSKTRLEITFNTNIDKNDFEKVGFVCQEIDEIIGQLNNKNDDDVITSYQLSHNSPFTIILTCVGDAISIITIAQTLYNFISPVIKDARNTNKQNISALEKDYLALASELKNEQIDLLKEKLKNAQQLENAQWSELSNIIENYRGKVITTTERIEEHLLASAQHIEQ